MLLTRVLLLSFACAIINSGTTQSIKLPSDLKTTGEYTLDWQGVAKRQVTDNFYITFLKLKTGIYHGEIPFIKHTFDIKSLSYQVKDVSANQTTILTQEELNAINIERLTDDWQITNQIGYDKGTPRQFVSFVPLRKRADGSVEKLISYTLTNARIEQLPYQRSSDRSFASNSVLASGDWYKIGVTSTGIHQIIISDLNNLGINTANLSSNAIHIFGNSAGLLPINNNQFRPDDLLENAIEVQDGGDGMMDSGDKILFYAKAADNIKNNGEYFFHEKNYYSDTSYYFILIDPARTPKRIAQISQDAGPVTHLVTDFNDFKYIDKDADNFIKSGREWYGDEFDLLTTRTYGFSFSNVTNAPSPIVVEALAHHQILNSSFTVTETTTGSNMSLNINDVGTGAYAPAANTRKDTLWINPNNDNLSVRLDYNKPDASAKGWLNTISVNVRRTLSFNGSKLAFRDLQSVGSGNVAEYTIQNASLMTALWDVTDPSNVSSIQFTPGSSVSFVRNSDSLREFIAFGNSTFNSIKTFGKVSNQDLHGLGDADYLMVVNPNFLNEANQLADFHRNRGLVVHVVTTTQVYNEFSSGMQDAVAIRDFCKMFYVRANGDPNKMPDYLLLFGDGSYDNKYRIPGNDNFVVTYQSPNSLISTISYTSDDFFGMLDPTEGMSASDVMDIGIGRLSVRTSGEAQNVINKIMHYATNSSTSSGSHCNIDEGPATLGDWRNIVAFVSDDEDGSRYVLDAESFENSIVSSNPEFNIDKIYLDAYVQESTPGGERYYDAQEKINERVQNGCLIMNYIGHGGEAGWAHERVLDIPSINAWNNMNNLPLFMTATCEFSRFDDPARVSAGELVLLNPNGGGFSLLTTTRLVYAGQNSVLNGYFYDFVFDEVNGEPIALGEVIRQTKNSMANGTSDNFRNFTLLGDPAIALQIPKHHVVTDSVNGFGISTSDTLGALSRVTIKGHISDNPSGTANTSFNGYIFPTVFDKAASLQTLQNNPSSTPIVNFNIWKNIIYKGKASVTNGEFEFSFVVPKDIAYNIGPGRISYYAHDGSIDAHGYNEDIFIGGADTTAVTDNQGPDIDLYLNDKNFVDGGTTDENPKMIADLFDENGINTVGNGIGHDITAIVDENTANAIILNNYYESDLDTYQSGMVRYDFSQLSEGNHTLSLKVWDVHNNSSEQKIEFVVANSEEMIINHLLNYPNPFTTSTTFFFEHNQVCNALDVQIQVFTISGRLVKTLSRTVTTEGYRIDGIHWDGLDDFGDQIGKGVYIYKLTVQSPDGTRTEKTEKLVILR